MMMPARSGRFFRDRIFPTDRVMKCWGAMRRRPQATRTKRFRTRKFAGSEGAPMSQSHILTGASPVQPVVRHISPADLFSSLKLGIADFLAMPSHAVFLCVIYPLLCF